LSFLVGFTISELTMSIPYRATLDDTGLQPATSGASRSLAAQVVASHELPFGAGKKFANGNDVQQVMPAGGRFLAFDLPP
jgi:hypothetical protein